MGVYPFFLLVLSLAAVSFGGGQALLAGLERELVHTGVITSADYAVAVAYGQATPGPIAAFTTAIGLSVAGVPGALVATLAIILVSCAASLLVGRIPPAWFRAPAVRGGLGAVSSYAAAIVFFLAWRVMAGGTGDIWLGPALIVALVVIGRLLKAPTALLVMSAVGLGMALQGTSWAAW